MKRTLLRFITLVSKMRYDTLLSASVNKGDSNLRATLGFMVAKEAIAIIFGQCYFQGLRYADSYR